LTNLKKYSIILDVESRSYPLLTLSDRKRLAFNIIFVLDKLFNCKNSGLTFEKTEVNFLFALKTEKG